MSDACHGLPPLTARLLPWQERVLDDHGTLAALLEEHGSPLNLLDPAPLGANAAELHDAAAHAGVELAVYFARKANKALCFVDEARDLGHGVDLAGEQELEQALARGMPANRMVMTAAVKPRRLLQRCLDAGVTVVLDNGDEIDRFRRLGGTTAALRLAIDLPGREPTRFGLPAADAIAAADGLGVEGVHFHLDGYDAQDRIRGIVQALDVVNTLRGRGHPVAFIDMGGGIPMSYLDSREQWETFWAAHRTSPTTFAGQPLERVYPYHQSPTRGAWLARILTAVAEPLRTRGLQLRCEPGRSLLDGCGLTAARVAHRKQRPDGTWLVALEMNRTQCRSTSDDFLVDPLLVRAPEAPAREAVDAYLVGAYCIERELLALRQLRFPHGVGLDDIVVFPNTAGYLMHILESSSHQMPLARNLVLRSGGPAELDPIDEPDAHRTTTAPIISSSP